MPTVKDKKQHPGKRVRKDIQALRAFAVASVVLYHLWPEHLVGGFTGVDIFFVISGYLMTTSIMGRLTPLVESQNINIKSVLHLLGEFYARRIKRLVPAALVTLTGVLGLAAITNNLSIIIDNAKNVISAATFWENWHLAKQSVDYLHQSDAPTAAQHFWSLSLEEQFYLMWPLMLIAATLVTINIVVYYKRSKISGVILPIILITLGSVGYGYWLTQSAPSIAYFSTPARIWELMVGGIIAFLPIIKNYDLKLLLPYSGLAMCLYSIFFITGNDFPGWHALIPTIGVALIILGGTDRAESKLAFVDIFRWRPIQWIGDISYSIYLWHWPLIILLPVILHLDIDGQYGRVFKIGVIILSLVLAYLSFRFIEEPARKVQIKTRYIYLIFLIATGVVSGGGFALKYYGEDQIETRLDTMHAAAMDTNNQCFGARALLHQNICKNPYGEVNNAYGSVGREDDFVNRIQDADKSCYIFNPRDANQRNTSKYCAFGDLSAERTIILLGDSHAEQYINAFNDIGKRRHFKITLLDSIFCNAWGTADLSKRCKDRLEYITSSGILDSKSIIVISFLFIDIKSATLLVNAVKASTSTRVVLLQDIPPQDPERLARCYTYRIDCSKSRDASTGPVSEVSKGLIGNNILSREQIIDMSKAYCDPSQCYSFIGGVPIYSGTSTYVNTFNSHITASYSLSLSPLLEQKLSKLNLFK